MLFRKSFYGKVFEILNDAVLHCYLPLNPEDLIMNKRFTHFLLFPAVVLLASMLNSHCLAAQLVDRVVAIVNDDVITMSEVNEAGRGYFKKITDNAPSNQLEDALRRARGEVLNTLIDKRLIALEAAKQGVTISEAEVQAAAEQVMASNNMTREMLDAQLGQMGMSHDSYLDTLRNQILQSKLVNYEVRSKLIITDDMILDYYDTNYTKHISGGGYYLMQMGFMWGKETNPNASAPVQYADKMDAKKRAERVRKLLVNGQDFRMLAEKFSDLPSAADGGDLGVFQKDEMADYMKEAVLPLSPGEISEIVETPSGYQFFKLLSSQDGQIVVQASFASVKDDIRQKLYDQQLKEQFDKWVSKIKTEAYIKRL